MDGANLINLAGVSNPAFNETPDVGQITPDDRKLRQLSKDFESVLVTKLVDTMRETVEQWQGEQEDVAAGQVKGMFWYYLSQDVSDKGGFGLWKDLYRFFADMQKANTVQQSPDGSTMPTIDEGL
jgi:Rod binding domain-containing protein